MVAIRAGDDRKARTVFSGKTLGDDERAVEWQLDFCN